MSLIPGRGNTLQVVQAPTTQGISGTVAVSHSKGCTQVVRGEGLHDETRRSTSPLCLRDVYSRRWWCTEQRKLGPKKVKEEREMETFLVN